MTPLRAQPSQTHPIRRFTALSGPKTTPLRTDGPPTRGAETTRCPGCTRMHSVHACYPGCGDDHDDDRVNMTAWRVADLRSDLHPLWHKDRRERWLPVLGWEGMYSVSDLGRVRRVARTVLYRDGRRGHYRERILKLNRNSEGYFSVCLFRGGNGTNYRVHRLVAEAFHGPAPGGRPHVLHWNDRRTDNRLENLRFGSESDNHHDSVRNGMHHWARKAHCPAGHPYDEANTRIDRGWRRCRECARARNAAYRRERRANMTDEQRERRNTRQRARYANMTPEQRAADRARNTANARARRVRKKAERMGAV
jgi:hypothetical protein